MSLATVVAMGDKPCSCYVMLYLYMSASTSGGSKGGGGVGGSELPLRYIPIPSIATE